MKKICLLSPFFYPEPISTAKYNTYLLNTLLNNPETIAEVISLYPFYPEWKMRDIHSEFTKCKIRRGGRFLKFPNSILIRRAVLEIYFTLHVFQNILKQKKIDIFLPVFPPVLFFFISSLVLPRKSFKAGIVHDLLSVMAGVSTSGPKSLIMKIIKFIEKKAFERCDRLIFVSDSMAQIATSEYNLNPDQIYVAYPFPTIEKTNFSALTHIFRDGFKHIVYSGALGAKQEPRKLLEFFHSFVQTRDNYHCHIFSRGPLFDEIQKETQYHHDRIFFHDLVPEKNLYELYLYSDVQIIPQKSETSQGAIPSKLPNILASGVPVFGICSEEGDLAALIKKSGIGFVQPTFEISQACENLSLFIEKTQNETHFERQKRIDNFVQTHFGIERLSKLILQKK